MSQNHPMAINDIASMQTDVVAQGFFEELNSCGIRPTTMEEARRYFKVASALYDKELDKRTKQAAAKDPLAKLEKLAGLAEEPSAVATAAFHKQAVALINNNPQLAFAVVSGEAHRASEAA